ncbi:uncharacterized protein LOC135431905 [Drosophila montana]|uniref:uncharacterized protein LOC135431905 n=1 Tax=Drosophila montana TaxID=40370 RepID=UPI00313D9159
MLNLSRTLTSINPYEMQSLSGRLLNRQCLNQKVKAVAQQLKWNTQLHDCNAFRNCWQFYANGQKPVSFFEQQRRKMANRGFVDRIKNQKAAKFLQLFATAEFKGQGNVYDQMYDEFVSCFKCPQPGPCTTKKIKRHLPRKTAKVVTAARPATRNEGKKLKPMFKINPALLPQLSMESASDKRRIRFKDANIRTKPGIIYKSWISTVGTSADTTSREDSVELEAIVIPREELQQNEKPENLKTDAKPNELQQSVKPEDLKTNVQPKELQQNVKELKHNIQPEELQNNVKPKQLKYNAKSKKFKHNISLEEKLPENQIPEIPKPIEPTGSKGRDIARKEVSDTSEQAHQRTQKEIELAEIALLEEQARRRQRRITRSHSEPNLKSKSFKHHKSHAQKKKTAVGYRRTGTSIMSGSDTSIRSTQIRHMKKFQKEARLKGLFKYRLSSTPVRYSSHSIASRKSYGRASTMSRSSVRYRGSAMSTFSGARRTTSPVIDPGQAPTSAAVPAASPAAAHVPRPAPTPLLIPLPIVNGPIKKKTQRSSIPLIKPTIYMTKKIKKVTETPLDTALKTKPAIPHLKKFTSDPLPNADMASNSSIDSPTQPAETDWAALKLRKLSSFTYDPSHEIFENFLHKNPPIDVKQHVHDFMSKNNINFDMFQKFPRNWPLPFESKLVRRMRSEKRKGFSLPKISRKIKKTEKKRRKSVPEKPKPEPELLKVPSCEICRNFNQTEPDQPYMIEMKKREAREELKRYYRRKLMAQSSNSQTVRCAAPDNFHFSSQPDPNIMEMKLRELRDELESYRLTLPTESLNSQTARDCTPEEPYVHFSSRPEPNMIEMRKQQVRDELKTHYSRSLSTSSSQTASGSRLNQAQSLRPSLVHLNCYPKQFRKHKEKQTMRQKLVVCYKMLCDCETLLDNKLKQLHDHERCL